MKYINKKIYFRDVIIFINRFKGVIRIKNAKLLRYDL